MDSVADILSGKQFAPPDEIALVKDYVRRRYKSPCSVKIQTNAVILSVRSSALSGTIFLERQALIDACGLKKRLVIRVGS